MPTTEIFKCRVCGGEAYSAIYNTALAPFGRSAKPDHFVCETCSVVFDDPIKFTEPE